jgi:hypothetical protein
MSTKQRDLFEAAAREIIPGIPAVDGFRRNAHGEYCTILLQLAWEMWCAAITSRADIVTVSPTMSLEWEATRLPSGPRCDNHPAPAQTVGYGQAPDGC